MSCMCSLKVKALDGQVDVLDPFWDDSLDTKRKTRMGRSKLFVEARGRSEVEAEMFIV